MNLAYGKVTTEEVYRDGAVIDGLRRTEVSIPIASKQELLDVLFDQLNLLQTENSIVFEIFAKARTHEPCRIVVTYKHKLDAKLETVV